MNYNNEKIFRIVGKLQYSGMAVEKRCLVFKKKIFTRILKDYGCRGAMGVGCRRAMIARVGVGQNGSTEKSVKYDEKGLDVGGL